MTARVIVEDPYIIIMDLFHQKRSPIQMMVWMLMDSLHLEAVVSNIFYQGILQKTIRGWGEKKYTDVFKSGCNILDQSSSKALK